MWGLKNGSTGLQGPADRLSNFINEVTLGMSSRER
jgi:hypothetical protein